jgi:hypothetical protein
MMGRLLTWAAIGVGFALFVVCMAFVLAVILMVK